jgi:kynurenine formamidase
MHRTRAAYFLAVVFVVVSSGCGGTRRGSPQCDAAPCLVDLTHAFDDDTIYWPTAPSKCHKETLSYGVSGGGYFYSAYSIATPEHGGTHIDAPIHFAQGQATTEAIPLERLVAPGVVIDMAGAATNDSDALLTVQDIEAFERSHGTVEPGTIVLIRTGWAEYWPDPKRYLGDDTPRDASNLHFPGISESAAHMLVARNVAAVGIDTASIDHGPSKDFIAHRILMEAGIPGFENVANLDQVPARGADIVALPMKIAGGSGGPLRIIAMVPRPQCSNQER